MESNRNGSGRLFFLDIDQTNPPEIHGRILSCKTDGSDHKVILDNLKYAPDGIAVDHDRKHIWWTSMGAKIDKDGSSFDNDGSIHRCDIDGGNVETIIQFGQTHTPKQCVIAPKSGKLYWCDREGMRVMRANLDGSEIETLVKSGQGDEDMHDMKKWCVGITVDEKNGKVYWSQKGPSKGGKGRIFRANLKMPEGEKPESRSDVETLFENLPEPIDMMFDEDSENLYWTDRGAPPNGNTVNMASMGSGAKPGSTESKIIVKNLHEGIGISLDLKNKRMFFGDLEGNVYEADLDGSNEKLLLRQKGNTTGVAYVGA